MKMFYKLLSGRVHRSTARIINSLIDALNNNHRLPCFLVVMLDNDIIKDVDVFARDALGIIVEITYWLVRQVEMIIRRKKAEIMEKKPGAIFSGDPKIIFVRMIRHHCKFLTGNRLDTLFGLRAKFNDALNELVSRIDQKMLTITLCNSYGHFDQWGNLSPKRKVEY